MIVERTAIAVGIVGLACWVGSSLGGPISARRDVNRFASARAAGQLSAASADLRLWSPERIRAWQDAQSDPALPLAILRVPKIRLEVPVLQGTSEWTLNRAVGHIEETAGPGGDGNIGLAGHRDGFFRGLADVRAGDLLEIESPERVDIYSVERTWIVQPEDVWVLDPTAVPSVTLVTCYPFYFIGPAPQRFIVRAVRIQSTPARHTDD